jgi:tripartite-type tricarboxylate transporter receptor subunit TctC
VFSEINSLFIINFRGKIKMKRKHIALVLAVALLVSVLSGCSKPAEGNKNEVAWPEKTVEVIVPAGAGGDTDFNARTFAKYFEKITGKSMIVTNMNGGGGSIATSHVKAAKNDGSIALFGHTGQLIVNEVSGLIDYNYEAFDVACSPATDKGSVLASSKQSGITSIKDLTEKAKAKPGSIIYGTELGGFSHLQGLRLQKALGIEMKIVDAGSASEKITALLGGRIHLGGGLTYGSVKDYQKTGDMVILGQYNEKANELIEGNVPTFKEAGVDLSMEKPYIIAFPKGTDPKIIKKMSEIAEQISKDPDYAKDIAAGFKQPVTFKNTADTLTLLKKTRDDYMQYKELLKK